MPPAAKKTAADAVADAISALQKAQALISHTPVSNGDIRKAQALATGAIKSLETLLLFTVSGPDDELNKKRGL